ncbi:MAG: hypothetical protein RIG68_23275 [Imperialibacter sp.]|uniref:hypothetical protein n=1 Tax=Imperialibacter sp. TaxID=2038411 RepID=UPI0032EC9A78
MRKIIILLIILAACEQPSQTVQQQVFDDFLLLHFNSWGDAIGRNYVPEFSHELGDTVRLRSELGMLVYPTDTTKVIELDDDNYYIILDSGTLLNITSEPKKFAFDAQVLLNDSTYNGAIFIDRFINAQWGEDFLNQQRKNLLEQLFRLKNTGLFELSTKYELSEDSILTLISYEYFERTGRRGINY